MGFGKVTAANCERFLDAVEDFGRRNGEQAAINWLIKENPWVETHISTEYAFTGEGYTRWRARALVRSEFAHGALPEGCECGGVLWWKATVSALICPSCGELKIGPYRYLNVNG